MNIYQKLAVTITSYAILVAMKATPATAAIFDFSYSGTGVTSNGKLTTDPYDPATSSYRITGINGKRNGVTIDSLASPSVINDNLLLLSNNSLQLDENGLIYNTGGNSYNLYKDASGYFEFALQSDDNAFTGLTTFSVAATVPEPSFVVGTLSLGVLAGCTLLKQKQQHRTKGN
ncbi:MAG: hypothetical protein JO235_25915 [Chroococcidiopsidaceae cyanobacterium CP_BM_RX_35]|nr:hypothetical protein [Chroococcidiopsidaceae cyanobacterium CP_BM_RX_35]